MARYEFYVQVARTICHENIKFIYSSLSVMIFLLHRHTDIGVFDNFPKFSDHFPKVIQNLSECNTNVNEHFRRLPKTFEEGSKMFRSYTNKCEYNLRETQ